MEFNVKQVRNEAENYYESGAYYCSEAVVKSLKDAFDLPYGDEVIKLASGFPVGMGSGCVCGAINGGVMVIGMMFGRDKPYGSEVQTAMSVTAKLNEEFKKKRKACCCKFLTRGLEMASPEHLKHCVEITGEITELTANVILEELNKNT